MNIRYYFLLTILLLLTINSCNNQEEYYSPKPKGYFRIDLPEPCYQPVDTILPFTFDYSCRAKCTFEVKEENTWWMDISYPNFKASFLFTYIPLRQNLRDLAVSEEQMIGFHIDYGKADDVQFSFIEDSQNHIYGRVYDIVGKDVASPLQFWVTDSVKHYLRASLYFDFAANNDSLQPVIDYLRQDALAFINSLYWK